MSNACLFSGGKDSTLALHKAVSSGMTVDLLITMLPESRDSYMFHYPNLKFTKLQAEALGIRQVFAMTKGIKEEELKDLEEVLAENKVKGLVTGATYSTYQLNRIKVISERLGIDNFSPLWHIEPMSELKELAETFDAIITSVSAEGFDKSYLGAKIDENMIAKLLRLNQKYNINMLFEGGEAESFVLDAPLFKKRIKINKSSVEWQGTRGLYQIEEAELAAK